jgi:hypothetical protein
MSSTTKRFGLPYVWPTWLTGLLSGDKQCTWALWYRAHFKYEKRRDDSFDSAAWSAGHQSLLLRRVKELSAEGWTCRVESQNDFKLKGRTALLSGKPDILAERNGEWLVVDCKTGRARNSDFFQVLLYMLAVPRSVAGIGRLRGEVCYPDRSVDVAPEALTPLHEESIFAMLRVAGQDEAPEHVPSANECRFCDVADCRERFKEAAEEQPVAVSAEF